MPWSFAFGPTAATWYVNNGEGYSTARGVPADLSALNDSGVILNVTFFPKNGFFALAKTAHQTKTRGENYPDGFHNWINVQKDIAMMSVTSVQFDASQPGRWLVHTENGRTAYHNLSPELTRQIHGVQEDNGIVESVVLGWGGKYVMFYRDEAGMQKRKWQLFSEDLDDLMARPGDHPTFVALDPFRNDNNIFVLYSSGHIEHRVPPAMHANVEYARGQYQRAIRAARIQQEKAKSHENDDEGDKTGGGEDIGQDPDAYRDPDAPQPDLERMDD